MWTDYFYSVTVLRMNKKNYKQSGTAVDYAMIKFIRLKQTVYVKGVLLREFEGSYL